MVHLINTTKEPNYFGITQNKEDLLTKISKMFDSCIEHGCTCFDVTINTDVDCEEL